MAKPSRAKVKKLQSEAMRAAAERRAEKTASKIAQIHGGEDLDPYSEVDGIWRELGLAAPTRRALVDAGLLKIADLRKERLADLKELHGMGPNAIRILVAAMKKEDISFRN